MPVDPAAVTLRRARSADVAAIIRLLQADRLGRTREILTDPLPGAYLAAFAEIDSDPRSVLMVAELDGQVAGTFHLTFLRYLAYQGALSAQIESVHVGERWRSQGLGRIMLDWAIAESRRRGCHRLQLTTNKVREDAHRFYRRLGFEASHEGMKLSLV